MRESIHGKRKQPSQLRDMKFIRDVFLVTIIRLDPNTIIVFGRSLGGAVSVSLACRHPAKVSAVILENTFLSIAAMVDVLMPFVSSVKNLVLRIGWNNDVRIQQLAQPILFISGNVHSLLLVTWQLPYR